MRNLLTEVPKTAHRPAATLVRTIFDQADADTVHEQFELGVGTPGVAAASCPRSALRRIVGPGKNSTEELQRLPTSEHDRARDAGQGDGRRARRRAARKRGGGRA